MKTTTISLASLFLLFVSSLLLGQTASPVSNFLASADTICVGGSVQFTDISLNTPTSWNWTFYGGSPAT